MFLARDIWWNYQGAKRASQQPFVAAHHPAIQNYTLSLSLRTAFVCWRQAISQISTQDRPRLDLQTPHAFLDRWGWQCAQDRCIPVCGQPHASTLHHSGIMRASPSQWISMDTTVATHNAFLCQTATTLHYPRVLYVFICCKSGGRGPWK